MAEQQHSASGDNNPDHTSTSSVSIVESNDSIFTLHPQQKHQEYEPPVELQVDHLRDLEQNDSNIQQVLLPSVEEGGLVKTVLSHHRMNLPLVLTDNRNSREGVEISSPPEQPPQQLLQDVGPPSPLNDENHSQRDIIFSSTNASTTSPFMQTRSGQQTSAHPISNPVIKTIVGDTEQTNSDDKNAIPQNTTLQTVLQGNSLWDVILQKTDYLDLNEIGVNNCNSEKLSLVRVQKLVAEIEKVLETFSDFLLDCCSISLASNHPENNDYSSWSKNSISLGNHLSSYLYSLSGKEIDCDDENSAQNECKIRLKVTLKDTVKIEQAYQKSSQHIPYLPLSKSINDAEIVEELLLKIDPECRNVKHENIKSGQTVINTITNGHHRDKVEFDSTKGPIEKKLASEVKLESNPKNYSVKRLTKKKAKQKAGRVITEQQIPGPPPPPIIREDGKRIYKKQKVISGYFSHYPISEIQYNEVIEGGEPFTCPPCQREFKHRRSWEHHLNGRCLGMPLTKPSWYKRDGKYFCSYEGCPETAANRGWTTSYMVWVHFYRVHSPGGQLPHKCDLCDKSYAKVAQLRIHRESKHNINRKTYTCGSCGRVFAYLRSMREHERRHKGDKPFACEDCGHRAVSISQIHTHKKLHHQDAPHALHVCDICGKGFKRKSNLQEHIPTHSDTRTFLCTICGRYLKTDNSYRRHMVCVHGVKYTCVVCRKDFSSQLGLQIHQRDKHGMTT